MIKALSFGAFLLAASGISSVANAAVVPIQIDHFSGVSSLPAINDNGYIAYTRDVATQPGFPQRNALMLWDGATSTELFATGSEFYAISSDPQLNDANAVLVGVYGVAGGALVRADLGGANILQLAGRPAGDVNSAFLAANGDVLFAYDAFSSSDPDTIEVWGAGAPAIAHSAATLPFDISSVRYSSAGHIGYSGFTPTQPGFPPARSIYMGDLSGQTSIAGDIGRLEKINNQGQALVSSSLGLLLIDGTGIRTISTDFFNTAELDLNNNGQVAYVRTNSISNSPEVVITDGVNSKVFGTSSLGSVVSLQQLQLNDVGTAVFVANVLISPSLVGTSLSFTEGNVVTEILRTGDSLGGRIVLFISLGLNALNNNGKVAFKVEFEDLTSAIYFADLFGGTSEIPVPGAMLLLVTGIAAGAVAQKRRRANIGS